MVNSSEYLTLAQAAQEIDVPLRTLQRHAANGKLRIYRERGRAQLVSRTDLGEYLAQKRASGQQRLVSAELRLSQLELRVRALEAALDVGTTQRVTLDAESVTHLREVLINRLTDKVRWGIGDISAMLGDLSRLSADTVAHIGRALVITALERCVAESRLLRHSRSELYVARALIIMRELRAQPEEAEHLGAGW
jgi:excisionase family DNA binding protein